MEIRIFAHSWLSDWNHGNAHFLRGLARALIARGHRVQLFEPLPGPWGGWSLAHLFAEEPLRAMGALIDFRRRYAELPVAFYATPHASPPNGSCRPWPRAQFEAAVANTDLVLVHEWNEPELLDRLVALRRRHRFLLLLHDTHHRSHSDPSGLRRFPLAALDGVLAFGESIRRIYRRELGVERCYTLHEAADVTWMSPAAPRACRQDVVWIGNWGDDERTSSLREFLLEPAAALPECRFAVHGVRYPAAVRRELGDRGIAFRGYLPNLETPAVYAASRVALHIPRGAYANGTNGLTGIPTIRVFEALACGAPLLCSPWRDEEGLFQADEDFVVARDGREAAALIRALLGDEGRRRRLGVRGRETILGRHTCAHRAAELEELCRHLG